MVWPHTLQVTTITPRSLQVLGRVTTPCSWSHWCLPVGRMGSVFVAPHSTQVYCATPSSPQVGSVIVSYWSPQVWLSGSRGSATSTGWPHTLHLWVTTPGVVQVEALWDTYSPVSVCLPVAGTASPSSNTVPQTSQVKSPV